MTLRMRGLRRFARQQLGILAAPSKYYVMGLRLLTSRKTFDESCSPGQDKGIFHMVVLSHPTVSGRITDLRGVVPAVV
jgi:hypothetical protein